MAANGDNESTATSLLAKGVLAVTLVAAVAVGAYQLGSRQAATGRQEQLAAELKKQLAEEKARLRALRSRMEAELDALALRLGSLRAHMLRLDALGERLVKKGKLDAEEFDFSREPPLGGVDGNAVENAATLDISEELKQLDRSLKDREHKLELLEELLMQRELSEQVRISGRPVKQGWISSGYGRRTDPFTGKKRFHRGIDFAGKAGSEVLAVAAGVVIESKWEKGYGNVVEIRHADAY
ncbi:MAG TPA: hypothetical protein ENJ98_00495, partial [Thiolapillus brandeum]|nr:hypothetical protein [Thiolapillus brandeum]